MKKLKLTIELVPEKSWHNNLRSLLGQKAWDTLRKRVYADFGHRCGVCGARGMLECHEVWDYDDSSYIQKLSGCIALCSLCHAVKHIGLTALRSGKGEVDEDTVLTHFMKINGCTRLEFESHKREAFAVWEERSRHTWTVDVAGIVV